MKVFLSLFVLVVTSGSLHAATDPEVVTYHIPTDAIKGEVPTKAYNHTRYLYRAANAQPQKAWWLDRSSILAYETYVGKAIVERELFKGGLKHGVQREWYPNGHLKSESPYKNGVMDGTFRVWDEKGRLLGQYELVNGTGTRRLYFSNGRLRELVLFQDNKEDGSSAGFYDNGQLSYTGSYKRGEVEGLWLSFRQDGSLESISWRQGPFISFSAAGSVSGKMWHLKDSDVDERTYAEAVLKDPTLPPYYRDATQYKKFVTPEIRALIERYRALPPVKIPVEINAQGDAIFSPTLKRPKKPPSP